MGSTWINLICNFLKYIHGSLELDKSFIPPLQRLRDCKLVDDILQSNKVSAMDNKCINLCCLFLGVVTLVDVTRCSGKGLQPELMNGNINDKFPHTQCYPINHTKLGPFLVVYKRGECKYLLKEGTVLPNNH